MRNIQINDKVIIKSRFAHLQKTFLYMGGVFLCDFVYCCDIERYDVQLTKSAPIYNIIYGFITLVAPYLYLKNGHNGRDVLSLRHITKWPCPAAVHNLKIDQL